MAAQTKTINFLERQSGIVDAVVVNLKFDEGDLRAAFVPLSEVKKSDGTWTYQFYIQEDDLPGALEMDDVIGANLIDPYWEVPGAEEEDDEDCPARQLACFEALTAATSVAANDRFAILFWDATCEQFCIKTMTLANFKTALGI